MKYCYNRAAMQVLHIIRATGLAGAENHLLLLLPGLRSQGIDARLWLWVDPAVPADEIVAAVEARGIPVERWVMPGNFSPRFFWRIVRHLRQQRPDLVHTHLVHAETYAIPAAWLAGIPVINSLHNDDPFRRHSLFRLRSWLWWRMTRRRIAISEAIRRFMIEIEYAPPQKVEAVYYGMPPSSPVTPEKQTLRAELGLPPDVRLIGSTCRLIEQKGLADALEAMAELMPHFPMLHYVIAGEGNQRAALEAQAQQLGISERVHFLGWRTDTSAIMAQLEIFLAPSLWEGFGLVFLEAMAQSRPIISTTVTSIPEVIANGETGLLVPPQDSKALAAAIKTLLDDPARADQMGQAGRERLEREFSLEKMVSQTSEVYQRVLRD